MSDQNGFSLWMVPEGNLFEAINREIQDLAKKYNSPVFTPHLTLAPDIKFDDVPIDKVPELIEKISSKVEPFNLTIKDIGGQTGSLYQCLYLVCDFPEKLKNAVKVVRETLGRPTDSPFMPHISICYQPELKDEEKEKIKAEIRENFVGRSFRALNIQAYTSGEPVENWERIAETVIK